MSSRLIVVIGADGQLGRTLAQSWPDSAIPQYQLKVLSRLDLDIGDAQMTEQVLSALQPSIVVNAAAYTQVDKAESDKASADLINGEALKSISAWVAGNDAKLIHISTDFVFDGQSNIPYGPNDATKPLGVYGSSKLVGEQHILASAEENSAIVRTSWLYSEFGNNFVKTMISLMSKKDRLSVVSDQIGSPTSTHGLADLIFAMIRKQDYQGIYHWSDGASISWFEFAQEIQRQALAEGLLSVSIPITPISTREWPTPARRPAYSVLERGRALEEFDCTRVDWKAQLRLVVKKLASETKLDV